MSVHGVVFIVGVIMIISAIFIYSKSEGTALHDVLEKYGAQQSEIKELRELLNKNIGSVAEANTKVNGFDQAIKAGSDKIDKFKDEMDVFREQCLKLRGDQINMNEALSKKRPIVKLPTGPIQIEILGPSTPQAPRAQKQSIPQGVTPLGPTTPSDPLGTRNRKRAPIPTPTPKSKLGKGVAAILGDR